jgi:hypothetical protein
MIDEFRTDVTKMRKDGSRGRLRIDYGDPRPQDAVKWLFKFLDGARSAGDCFRGSEASTGVSVVRV